MKTPRAIMLGIVVIGTLLPFVAEASSCMRMVERFYVACRWGHCEPQFRSVPVTAYTSLCGRRYEIRELDASVGAYMSKLVEGSLTSVADGIYAVDLSHAYFGYQPAEGFDEFSDDINRRWLLRAGGQLIRHWQDLPYPDQIAFLNEVIGRKGKSVESTDATDASLKEFRQSLQKHQWLEQLWNFAQWGTFWLTSISAIAMLTQTTRHTFRRIRTARASRQTKLDVAWPVLLQLGLLVAGAYAAGQRGAYGAFLLLVPLVLIVLFAEVIAMISYLRSRRESS